MSTGNNDSFQEGVSQPERIGRYRIVNVLGEGAFGRVYLAEDDQLQRAVAIKIARPERLACPEDAAAYLTEARTVASLDHPNIVPIFDVGTTVDGLCYVVSKVIDGTDLAQKIRQTRVPHTDAAGWVATVAEALHYAHGKGLVHRDIKSANILIDGKQKPYIVDFGLALKREDYGKGVTFAGTPGYMSPEQARDEGHRVDGRSDIFSLSVVFYELLIGQRPFKADSLEELLEQIIHVEARPPRQMDDRIPKELERICLKALSKRASDRYSTAKDMADDLRHFLNSSQGELPSRSVVSRAEPRVPQDELAAMGSSIKAARNAPSSSSSPVKIVPKGLRSYGAHDADFFLELLPGPRDREGLPEGIRFWKTFIEETDAEQTFPVGLLYGPTGCGKSSLVKAGLLPRLSDGVVVVYLEATGEETEIRVLNGLRRRCPTLATDLGLKETLAALRRDPPLGKKTVIIIDQFEQWLHAKKEDLNGELTQALRQCDGSHLQCIVMVRDDFWMAATRFMRELEIRLLDGQNSAAVDLFPIRHAEKVLAAFGRAYGVLPDATSDMGKDQKQFIEQAVAGLAQEGKVTSVRLALFAEMVKGKAWTPAALKEVGGAEGVGVTFLEETFSAATAPPEHRYHQKAARGVLEALLPESGSDMKGHMKSHRELLEAAGYENRPNEFNELIRILDGEIRLITPTDPQANEAGSSSSRKGEKYYQLTHDYLVPALRRWLTYKQRETRRGRAELRLAERAAMWNALPENRHLPAWWEWLSVHLFTRRQSWNEAQRLMMGSANRYHLVRTLVGACILAALVAVGIYQEIRLADLRGQAHAKQLVGVIRTFRASQVEQFQEKVKEYRKWTIPLLQEMIADPETARVDRLHARLVLLPLDESQVEPLVDEMLSLDQHQYLAVRRALLPYKDLLLPRLEAILAEPAAENKQEQHYRRRARAAGILFRLGRAESVWPLLRHSPNPSLRSFLIDELASGRDPQVLVSRFVIEPDISARRAILIVLGDYNDPFPGRPEFIERLHVLYGDDPDPGLHAAIEWLLRKWGEEAWIHQTNEAWANDRAATQERIENLRKKLTRAKRSPQWYVNSQAQTMVVIPGPVQFVMGSPTTEVGREEASLHKAEESQHEVRIARTFALAAKLVTIEQYRRFNKERRLADKYTRSGDLPAVGINWYMAAAYCNWLSKEEGINKDQWCYETDAKGQVTRLKENYLSLAGYRLPTEAEMEYSIRAGALTSRYYGDSEQLLPKYAWYQANSSDRTWPVGSLRPNDLGFFDMLGNAYVWCQESYKDYPSTKAGEAVEDREGDLGIDSTMDRVLRGNSYARHATSLRSADRFNMVPTANFVHFGFRVARTLAP